MMGTVVVVGAIAAVVSPMVLKSSEQFARSSSQRRASEQAALALDRLARALREAPLKAGVPGAANFASASATGFALEGGVYTELASGTLSLGNDLFKPVPLCRDVSGFGVEYFDNAGASVNVASGTDTVRRVRLTVTAGGVTLSTMVWLRTGMTE